MSCPASLCAIRSTFGRSALIFRRFRLNSANPSILTGSIVATGSPPRLLLGHLSHLLRASDEDAPPHELVVVHLPDLGDRLVEPLPEEELELDVVVVFNLQVRRFCRHPRPGRTAPRPP